ncbi:site-2 protease family protein [Nocardia cyriacigeorgica]|uniref:site-2 protease family protein n=1 Tax=Nocardia cyriacigeorgica TaxID=135487 RepID=UPI0018962FED|nr:site-2 protease family protein [Nocardia cyriacigeorgica]MBF6315897.1 site-2 protease family protein [Nocardia cyriacigeorgica]MBF6530682.1 site-2 protease family protein [Nocardia cyriacigeorgica]
MSFPAQARRSGAVRPSPVFLLVVAITALGGALAWDADLDSVRAKAGVFLLVVFGWIVSLCLHEFAHAYVAWRAGDREVELRGYLTLNPLKYSHPLLSIVLPIVFIALGGIGLPGGAVYVHAHNFSTRVQRIISGAGPAVNVACAALLLLVVRLFGSAENHAAFWFGLSFLAFLQVTAALLNLIPIPGLDGYGILEPSLSYQTRRALDQFKPFGMLILFALLFTPAINQVFFDAVYALYELSGVPSLWSRWGGYLTRFWT